MSCTEFNFRFKALTLSIAVCLRSNRSYNAGSDGELERGRVWILFSSSAICYHSATIHNFKTYLDEIPERLVVDAHVLDGIK